jgi:predicted PurR-regulated permease PerM
MKASVFCVTLLLILALAIVALLAKQLVDFAKEWPSLQQKFTASFQQLSTFLVTAFDVSREQQLRWITQVTDQAAGGLFELIKETISFSTVSLVMLVLIPIYVVLILYYRNIWVEVLYRVFPEEKRESISEILSLSVNAYYSFIKGMGLVYLVVGILNSIGLLLLGVPHAILFGFIASVLTFVPYIGILVGSLLPIAMAWITYDSIWYPVGIIAIFILVQYLEANIIFPFAVSSRLKVNALVMLLAIFAGGILWGLAGMILFVPFVGILKLIADHNPKLRTLAMALGTEKST